MRNRKLLITLGVLLSLCTIGLWLWRTQSFRLTGSTPALNGSLATSTSLLKLNFNRDLDTSIEYTDFLEGDITIINDFKTEGKSISIILGTLEANKSYSLTLKNIRSKKGEVIDSIPIKFKATYVPFNKLSKSQQQQEIQQTDLGNKEDPLEVSLPYQGDGFYLKGVHSANDNGEPIFIVDATIFLLRSELGPGREAAIQQYKLKVTDFIRSKQLDPNTYLIRYTINEPPASAN